MNRQIDVKIVFYNKHKDESTLVERTVDDEKRIITYEINTLDLLYKTIIIVDKILSEEVFRDNITFDFSYLCNDNFTKILMEMITEMSSVYNFQYNFVLNM